MACEWLSKFFLKFKVYKSFFCFDHERGVYWIAGFLLAITTASLALEFYNLSIFAMYWQVSRMLCAVMLVEKRPAVPKRN